MDDLNDAHEEVVAEAVADGDPTTRYRNLADLVAWHQEQVGRLGTLMAPADLDDDDG